MRLRDPAGGQALPLLHPATALSDVEHVRHYIRWLIAATAGGALAWVMFWLDESLLPGSVALSLEVSRLLLGIALLAGAAFIGRSLGALGAATFVAGAGLVWAVHEFHPLTICQADTLYRPCTTGEIGWMAIPPIALLAIAAGIAMKGLPSRMRHSAA